MAIIQDNLLMEVILHNGRKMVVVGCAKSLSLLLDVHVAGPMLLTLTEVVDNVPSDDCVRLIVLLTFADIFMMMSSVVQRAFLLYSFNVYCQCFDTVDWLTGREFGL